MLDRAEYPRVMYHPERGTATVKNQAEEQALGNGWSRHRAPKPEPVLEPKGNLEARVLALEAEVKALKAAALPPKPPTKVVKGKDE